MPFEAVHIDSTAWTPIGDSFFRAVYLLFGRTCGARWIGGSRTVREPWAPGLLTGLDHRHLSGGVHRVEVPLYGTDLGSRDGSGVDPRSPALKHRLGRQGEGNPPSPLPPLPL